MKIVLVIDQFDDSNNGTTVTARRFRQQLVARGHEVTVLAGGEPYEGKYCAPVHKIPIFEGLIESQGMKFAKPDEEAYYNAFKGADIIHFYVPFKFCRVGEKIARQMNIPTVAAFHCQPENVTSSIHMGKLKLPNEFLYRYFYRIMYRKFDNIHCPSQFIADQLEKRSYGARLWVISNGVDDAFRAPEIRPERSGDEFRVLMIGRLSGEKRQDLIIRAAALSRYGDRIKITLAGKGPKEKYYRKLAKKLAVSVEFGFYSQDELIEVINSSDLYIHASDAEIEGISCMESLACGLVPVISDSPLSATPQFALDEKCLFKAGDPKDLADKIDWWIEHPEEKAALSGKYAEQQDENRVSACVAKAEEMYRCAIEQHHRCGYRKLPLTRLQKLSSPNPAKIRRKFLYGGNVRRFFFTAATTLIGCLLWVINTFWNGLRVEGRENLKKLDSGAVSVMNHVHPMDCTMAKVALMPRLIWYVSLSRNLSLPFVGWLIKLCGGMPLPECPKNEPAEMTVLRKGVKRHLEMGDLVHIYPEGILVTRHKGLREFHNGAFVMAAENGKPILPMVMKERKGRGFWFWRRKTVFTLHICEPVYPDASLKFKAQVIDLKTRVTAAMNDALAERENAPCAELGEQAETAEI